MENIEPLDQIFLHLGPFTIYWYGVIIGVGVLIGLWLAIREGERNGISQTNFVDLVLYGLPVSIVCARIYYVIFQWDYYSANPGDIIKIWHGGIAIHGALIGAIFTAVVFCRARKLSFWKIADIAAPSILIGQMMGRWGNFMNQEAYGTEVTREFLESLYLPNFIINQMYIDGAYHHPTFLYESIWSLCGVILLLILRRRNLLRGEVFLFYLGWYSIGRFFVEGLRTDSLMLTDFLRMAQVISIVLVLFAVGIALYRRFLMKVQDRYND